MFPAFKAMIFAREVHKDQKRKYTGTPYVEHLAEVAGIVSTVSSTQDFGVRIAVAWLHDCIEDCGVAYSTLEMEFGRDVADAVVLLSDLEKGNRAERKAMSRARLAAAPGWVQTIKCADLISNTASIELFDPAFAKLYFKEKFLLLDRLELADSRLRDLAYKSVGQL